MRPSDGVALMAMSTGKRELCTESNCEHCGTVFVPRSRNGLKVRFCSKACSRSWHNAQRLKGAALLKGKKPAIQRPRTQPIRTLDELSAAEGLPPGCYSAGALGRLAGRRAGASTLADLLAAARRVGVTEEGETVTAARRAAHQTHQTNRATTRQTAEVPA